MKYLYETKLPMLIDADAVPVSHRRPYRDIDIRYPWKSDEQREAEDRCEIVDAIVFDGRIDQPRRDHARAAGPLFRH